MRIVVTLADISLGNLIRNTSVVTGTNITAGLVLNRSVQMICKPTYSLIKLRAKSNASDSSAPVILERIGFENFTFANLTAWDIAESVLSGSSSDMASSRPIQDYNPYYADNDPFQNKTDVDTALQAGAWLAGITGNINRLFEDGALKDVASSYYRAMAAQLMNKGLTQQNQTSIIGQALVNEDRVILLQLPLRLMEVCLILGILLAAAMIFLNPQDVIAPWKPTSISSTAAIMAKSATLRQALSETGPAPLDAIHDSLKERRYHSEYTLGGFVIKTESDGPGSLDGQQSHKPAWSPFPNLIVRGVIFFAVALVIAALEIVLHISQQNDGLGDVSTNQFQHYLWTIIPSLVMVSIGLLFGSIDFNTRSLAPYALLKRPAGAAFTQFMTTDYLDSLATTNIIRSIGAKQFAVMATTLAALITSFLTIITSGLYSVIEVPLQIPMNFTQETTFYTGKSARAGAFSTTQDPAIIIAEYIIQENLTYPRWTYDELVFPEITMNTPFSENDTKNSFVDIRVPALRAAPACHFQTGAQLQRNFTKAPWGNESTYQFKFLAPEMPCSLTNEDLGSTYSTAPSLIVLKTEGLFGKSGTVSCGNSTYSANPATWYMWGKLENGSVESVSAMTCIGAAETVDTLTRFQLPDFDITDEHPPVPDESSAVSASNVDVPWISWMIDGTTDVAAEYSNLDGFFTALVLGRYAIPAENLADPMESDKIIKAIKHQDSILKAQLFNNFTRTAANGTLDDSPLLGNITMSNRLRLLQDAASTRVLEALLASMLVLGILGSILMNTDRILPKNPSSIAAVASLLADSNVLIHYERVMGDPNEPSLGQAFFARCRFFLGFKEDGPHQGDLWHLSNAEYDKKYCIYFSEWDCEKIPSDHFGMTGESGHKRMTKVGERFI